MTTFREYLDAQSHETLTENNLEYLADNGSVRVKIDSSMLPGVTIDTYQTFTSEYFENNELEWLSTDGHALARQLGSEHPAVERIEIDVEYDDLDWSYDWDRILSNLAVDVLNDLHMSEVGDILRDSDVVSTWSPKEYNFQTDSFDAWYALDVDKVDEYLESYGMSVEDVEAWALDRWQSRSGFISHVPRYFEREHAWATTWAVFAYILDRMDYSCIHAETDETFHLNVGATPNARLYEKVYVAIMGRELPEDENGVPVSCESGAELDALLPEWQEDALNMSA